MMATVAPGSPRLHTITTPSSWVEKQNWMTTTVRIRLWSKEACAVHQQDNFPTPLTYKKIIAAGRARGSPSSRKTENKNKIIPFPVIHMKSKLWRITSSGKWQMSLLYFSSHPPSFPPESIKQSTNIVLC